MANPNPLDQDRNVAAFAGACEPALDDLYRDPVLQAILRRDGIDLDALKAVVANARLRLAA